MTENRGTPRSDVIDIFVAIHVPNPCALGSIDEKRLAADRAKRAHGGIHAAGNVLQSFGKQLFGLSVRHP